MKLVVENINEAIKHLVPKTAEEIKSLFKNLLPDEKLEVGAEEGITWLVQEALDEVVDIHADDDHALRCASEYGHVEVVKILLDAGADIHAKYDYALRWASLKGHTEIVKILLDAGADVNAKNNWALQYASGEGHTEVVKLLLAAGADIHAKNDYALRWAKAQGHTETVKILKKAMNVNEAIKHLSGRDPDEIMPEKLKELNDRIKKEFNLGDSVKRVKSPTNIYIFFLIALRKCYISYNNGYTVIFNDIPKFCKTQDEVINYLRKFIKNS